MNPLTWFQNFIWCQLSHVYAISLWNGKTMEIIDHLAAVLTDQVDADRPSIQKTFCNCNLIIQFLAAWQLNVLPIMWQ